MYPPVELANKPLSEIRRDLELITHDYAPCDMVFAVIESGTPDDRVIEVIELCEEMKRSTLELRLPLFTTHQSA